MRALPRLVLLPLALALLSPGALPLDAAPGEAHAGNKGGGGGAKGGGGGGGGGAKGGGGGAKSGGGDGKASGGGAKGGGDGPKASGDGPNASGGGPKASGGGPKGGGDGPRSGGSGAAQNSASEGAPTPSSGDKGADRPRPSGGPASIGRVPPAAGAAGGGAGGGSAGGGPRGGGATPSAAPRPAGALSVPLREDGAGYAKPSAPRPAGATQALPGPRPAGPARIGPSAPPRAGAPRGAAALHTSPSAQRGLELRAEARGGRTVPLSGASLWVTEGPRLVGGADGTLVAVPAARTRDLPPIAGRLAALEASMAPRGIGDVRLPDARAVDPRTDRPNPVRRLPHPEAGGPPPSKHSYGPRYTQWWVYPWWRYQSPTTVIVVLPGVLFPWMIGWEGPYRDGYAWIDGHTLAGTWWPGSYAPTLPAPEFLGVPYVWVEGYWVGERYVEGFWRPERRLDGAWVWVEGAYDAEGVFHPGYWEPAPPWPAGMTWEPGFFDGQQWVEGFFRPPSREGFVWVESRLDPTTGARHNGHWLPLEDRAHSVWVPGWFDGRAWVEGGWVPVDTVKAGVPAGWAPAPGAEPNGGAPTPEPERAPSGAQPLAVPVP